MIRFDRKTYFDAVRDSVFGGTMTQEQVDGQEFLLSQWEDDPLSDDLRFLAYPLATTKHEAPPFQPIEEWGKGEGHEYGRPDPETKQTYYGRGYVQLTWRDNYARATEKLGLEGDDDLEWHAARALDPEIAYGVLTRGMMEGWFTGKKMPDYFSETKNDPVGARKIVNPDDKGPLIAGYHADFLAALTLAADAAEVLPEPEPEIAEVRITLRIDAPPGVRVHVDVENGEIE